MLMIFLIWVLHYAFGMLKVTESVVTVLVFLKIKFVEIAPQRKGTNEL